jgi:hypothetical protein
MSGMAKPHDSKPVTKDQKVMSKRHKKHRKEVEKMADGPAKQAKARHYDVTHGLEHLRSPHAGVSKATIQRVLQETGHSLKDLKQR